MSTLSLAIFYLSWASGMTGVRGVAALFLDSIWSSILPISFLRSLAAGSTVSQTLTNKKSVLSVSANQSRALPGVVQLSLSLTRGTENLLTWKSGTKLFSSWGQRSKRDNYLSVHSCSLSRILPSESGRCWLYELRMTSWIRVRILKDRHILLTILQFTVIASSVNILPLRGLTEDWSMSTSDEPRKPQVQSQVLQ